MMVSFISEGNRSTRRNSSNCLKLMINFVTHGCIDIHWLQELIGHRDRMSLVGQKSQPFSRRAIFCDRHRMVVNFSSSCVITPHYGSHESDAVPLGSVLSNENGDYDTTKMLPNYFAGVIHEA
jgi:hypothetical protein